MKGGLTGLPVLALLVVVALVVSFPAPPSGHYIPRAGDAIYYHETIVVKNGVGTYAGYTENSSYSGSIVITSVLPNGTESASYQSSGTYANNSGGSYPWSESGTFTFSAITFLYVQGTDNQTGYASPRVWFYMNNSLSVGGTFTLLDTSMVVRSTNYPIPDPLASSGSLLTIRANGTGAYARSDAYGNFNATYVWTAYFDPSTGYIVGYDYVEHDTDGSGNGFTYVDTVREAAAPSSAPAPVPWAVLVVAVVVVVLVIVVVALALARRRARGGLGRAPLARHGETPPLGAPPLYGSPPPIRLTPGDQPPVQQIVMKEVVKVPCRFCGTLIDSTATACPKCGAPRT